MKKYILIFFVLQSCISLAQIGYYKIIVYGTGYQEEHATCEKALKITARFDDFSEMKLVDFPTYPERKVFLIHNTGNDRFVASKKLKSIFFYATRGYNNCWPIKKCCKSVDGEHTKNISFPYNFIVYTSWEKRNNTFGGGLGTDHLSIPKVLLPMNIFGDIA